jgi:H+/Cl- antiporter ClcA
LRQRKFSYRSFFTGVVRAPLTGIVLVTEMTASVTMLLPMLVACFAAMLVPTLLHDVPVYDALREHTLSREKARQSSEKKPFPKAHLEPNDASTS